MGSKQSQPSSEIMASQSEDLSWGDFAEEQALSSANAIDIESPETDDEVPDSGSEATQPMPSGAEANVHRRAHIREALGSLRDTEMCLDDPFWLDKFLTVVDSITDPFNANNFQRRLTLVSGCSGMLAEGWVLKAGPGPNEPNDALCYCYCYSLGPMALCVRLLCRHSHRSYVLTV